MTETPILPAWTLTRAEVCAILDHNTHHPTDKSGMRPIEIKFMELGETGEAGDYQLLGSQETKARIAQWCRDAFACVEVKNEDLDSHFDRVDDLFSTLITCNFQVSQRKIGKDAIVDGACALLARLPAYPPDLQFEYGGKIGPSQADSLWPVEYLIPAQSEDSRGRYGWTNLRTLSRPSTNVVRIALFLTMEPSAAFALTSNYADTLARILDTVTEFCQASTTEHDAQAWFILQAFLWAAWQQTVMSQLWYDATRQLAIGYSFERHNRLISREIPLIMPGRDAVEQRRPGYMCKWAFELLRSDLSSVTQDFRTLFEVYDRHFGDLASRCNLASGQGRLRVCDGKAPGNCERFESENVQIQSAHDFECVGSLCSFLTWDEQSYRSIEGARAVSLEETDGQYLRYCPLSSGTMAVSHVWSHGQGGRPETGFNICLHRRYTALARSLGCTSYWMDTPCIPTDDDLRDEAIGQINDNFINSKLTLLVDRDLMEIDIHPLTLQAEEAILAALVVCDWNIRAWTLLEGMRGRLKLHILCKDNRVISLIDVLSDITSKSNLALISPCLAIQHYTPTQYEISKLTEHDPVTTEQATCLLNHRHPTKDRDVIIIWSLICGTAKVRKTAVDFWKSTIGQLLATGFIISSTERLQDRGFSWAPSRPNLLPPGTDTPNAKQYPAYDGQNSVAGQITADGFKAEWLVCRIRRSRGLPLWFSLQTYSGQSAYYRVYNGGANAKMDLSSRLNLRSVIAPLLKQYRWVALLQPALRERTSSGPVAPPRPFAYQGEAEGPLLVIVGSNDGDEWVWQGVHEWDVKFQLPEFSLEELLIV
ncbi:hypothetical protein BDW59DRAFT_163218 [Aspergillus cavernicola]|uniref:Heterokaryon incompatibility domain-containing protein n=1 Tax=Aspergillus cavernicola TaxID=176166 RepID=A0ABR4I979_9EURO